MQHQPAPGLILLLKQARRVLFSIEQLKYFVAQLVLLIARREFRA